MAGAFALSGLLAAAFPAATVIAADQPLKSGIDRSTFDTSIKPGDDFFEYVNGRWIKENPIPDEYSRWGAFPKLHDDNLVALREIVEGLSKSDKPLDADSRKLRDFYKTAMDEKKLNEGGAKPLADDLDRIAKIQNTDDLLKLVGHFQASGISGLFGFGVEQDEKQSSRYAIQLWQGGLGLPERNYYLGSGDDSKRIRDQYREHVAKMLTLLGDSPDAAKVNADTVLHIETQLAEASRTPVQLRDREAQYNKMSDAELAELTPNVKWDLFWNSVNAQGVEDAIVGQPEFFKKLNELLRTISLDDWRTYLRWHLIHSAGPYLSDDFVNENFHFYGEQLRGIKQLQPRWKRAIGTLDRQMGEALGRLYVEKYFPPQAKQRMDELVKNLMLAYKERIESRDWMSPETKKEALAKLAAVRPKIGYPIKWRDYSGLKIGTDSYIQNVQAADAFETQYRLARLHKPVDRDEWQMSPPTVNAYYNPNLNEIVFPAGILQPPFFDMTADDAVNYGGIGAVIGHEITHGFDDQGSRSDADGNLRNWWTTGDRSRFNAKTDKLVKEYNACNPVDDIHINGLLTLGENLADLGGVTIAYAAYQKSLEGKPAPIIDGFTGPQRFFIGYAQVWRGSQREADLKVMLRTNPHSPERFRTLVPLSNIPAWYEAFDVQPSQTLYRRPEERLEVW
ncbi:MAG TPA: M13 family metallopeptidase [Pirellulales bacterium]|jgi:putative endopeptidase|nr:M13 family metallopeptidase [Pirellulales bacterium]